MAKNIRYYTPAPSKRNPSVWNDYFDLPITDFTFEFSETDADFLFATEDIYYYPASFLAYLRHRGPHQISVMCAMEAVFPDMNLFDYAISFDRDFHLDDRVGRKPILSFFKKHILSDLTLPFTDAEAELARKTGFCSFLYSNPDAHPHRDWLFHVLSDYKRVDSLGKHLNNCGTASTRDCADWRSLAVAMKRPYKFAIASENACYRGYMTEKIISSFQAHAIPIYWGDPNCESEFNPRAFLNANNLSEKGLIDRIRSIDENNDLWQEIASQPPVTQEQFQRFIQEDTMYRAFTRHIFEQTHSEAKRAPEGFWEDNYYRSFKKRVVKERLCAMHDRCIHFKEDVRRRVSF